MPPANYEHGRVCANLTIMLGQHVKANRLGVVGTEGGCKIESDPDTVLGPDVSFVAQDRISLSPEGYHDGSPDLVVEVLSPSNRKSQVERKLALWLETGARSVWLVDPRHRTVEVVKSLNDRRMLHEDDELVDETVPGFRVKVSEIFA